MLPIHKLLFCFQYTSLAFACILPVLHFSFTSHLPGFNQLRRDVRIGREQHSKYLWRMNPETQLSATLAINKQRHAKMRLDLALQSRHNKGCHPEQMASASEVTERSHPCCVQKAVRDGRTLTDADGDLRRLRLKRSFCTDVSSYTSTAPLGF
jgi:hypothetical protein